MTNAQLIKHLWNRVDAHKESHDEDQDVECAYCETLISAIDIL